MDNHHLMLYVFALIPLTIRYPISFNSVSISTVKSFVKISTLWKPSTSTLRTVHYRKQHFQRISFLYFLKQFPLNPNSSWDSHLRSLFSLLSFDSTNPIPSHESVPTASCDDICCERNYAVCKVDNEGVPQCMCPHCGNNPSNGKYRITSR